jgi:hypothetical protein
MADRVRRKKDPVDYAALERLSTADVYSNEKKKYHRQGSKLFQVERLISRRKCGKVTNFLWLLVFVFA